MDPFGILSRYDLILGGMGIAFLGAFFLSRLSAMSLHATSAGASLFAAAAIYEGLVRHPPAETGEE